LDIIEALKREEAKLENNAKNAVKHLGILRATMKFFGGSAKPKLAGLKRRKMSAATRARMAKANNRGGPRFEPRSPRRPPRGNSPLSVMEALVMGSISVACYKPGPGCEEALLALVRNHLPPLREQCLVTERASIVMRTAAGTIVEMFEWVSQEAIAGAHSNPAVLDLWKRFEAVRWYETPSNLPEFQNMFAHFEPI
jgi:hypothetical protein